MTLDIGMTGDQQSFISEDTGYPRDLVISKWRNVVCQAPWQNPGGMSGPLYFTPNATYDIGQNGANAPRDIWAGGNIVASGFIGCYGSATGNPVVVLGGYTSLYTGSAAPPAGLGNNGNFYFRGDTPGTAMQRIYIKSAGAWVGIV